jgi:hypothetical protein
MLPENERAFLLFSEKNCKTCANNIEMFNWHFCSRDRKKQSPFSLEGVCDSWLKPGVGVYIEMDLTGSEND